MFGLAARRVFEVRIPPLNDWQRELFLWDCPPEHDTAITGCLTASYGIGKSTATVLRSIRFMVNECRWDGIGTPPFFIFVAPSRAVNRTNVMPLLEAYLPADAWVRRQQQPVEMWTLFNGCHAIFWSGAGRLEGITARGVHVEEASHPLYQEVGRWKNIRGRVRGGKRRDGSFRWRKEVIVNGISEDTPMMRERFDRPDQPNVKIMFPGARDNMYLTEDDIKDRLEGASADEVEVILNGGWKTKPDLVFSNIDWKLNRSDFPIDYSKPAMFGLDVGTQASVVVGQYTQFTKHDGSVGTGLDVVGEYHTNGTATEDLWTRIRDEEPWRITPESWISIDSQAAYDAVAAVRKVFPNIRIIQQQRNRYDPESLWLVENGVHRVQWAACDAFGNRRLKFHASICDERNKRCLAHVIPTYVRKNGKISRPNNEHCADALRYLVQVALTPEGARFEGESAIEEEPSVWDI